MELKRKELEKSSDKVQETVSETEVGMGRLCGCYGRYGGEGNVPSKGWNSVNVETAAEASLLQRKTAPLPIL